MKLDKFEQEIEDNVSDYKKVSTAGKIKIDAIIKKAKEKYQFADKQPGS